MDIFAFLKVFLRVKKGVFMPENCSEATIPPKKWSVTMIRALFEKNIFDNFYYARLRFEILEK